jgi:hypothetical protein
MRPVYLLLVPVGLIAAAGCGYTDDSADDMERMAQRVRGEFEHAWSGYRQYAWGHDALRPLSNSHRDWYDQSLYALRM